MVKTPSCDSSRLPQKYLSFTDNYPNTQGFLVLLCDLLKREIRQRNV